MVYTVYSFFGLIIMIVISRRKFNHAHLMVSDDGGKAKVDFSRTTLLGLSLTWILLFVYICVTSFYLIFWLDLQQQTDKIWRCHIFMIYILILYAYCFDSLCNGSVDKTGLWVSYIRPTLVYSLLLLLFLFGYWIFTYLFSELQ